MDVITLGQRIQAARLAAGLTQQDLCEAADLSYSTLAKIERGAIKAPSIFTVEAICRTLDVDIGVLLAGKAAVSVRKRAPVSPKSASRAIHFVYCDINGVLVRFYQRAFAALARDSKQPLDVVEQVFWRYNDAVCRGELSVHELNKNLSEALEFPEVNWLKYYIDAVEPIPQVQAYLRRIISDYPVGLLSNIFPGFLQALIDEKKIPKLPYAAIVDSSKEHEIKPNKKIYQVAEEHAGAQGKNILFIDDTRANIIAAQRMNWRSIWFDSYHPNESIEDIQSVLKP